MVRLKLTIMVNLLKLETKNLSDTQRDGER
jgi:hypothetical protein